MTRLVSIALMLGLCATAHAGFDCPDDKALIAALEAVARDRSASSRDFDTTCFEGDSAVRLRPQIEKACAKLLDRDGANSACWRIAAAAGITKLGDHDIFEWVTKIPEDPIEFDGHIGFYAVGLLAQMRDPRGVAVIVKMWNDAIPRAEKREKRKGSMMGWSSWRQAAARALGVLGGNDEIAFLEQQAKATVDKGVARACREAEAAIQKRLIDAAKR